MPVYTYLCKRCDMTYDRERSVVERYDVTCPWCCVSEDQEIQLHPVQGKMVHQDRIVSEAQINAEKGSDWRETPGSRRIRADEPERLYSAPGDVTRRKTKKAKP